MAHLTDEQTPIELTIDAADFTDPREFHEWIARELAFPSYYGANLAALEDCLEDLAQPLQIEIHNIEAAPEPLRVFYGKVLVIAARHNAHLA